MTRFNMFTDEELDASEVGVEIVKGEESEKSGIKYLNINMSDDEVKRNPDIVRLSADVGILEYVRSSGDLISRQMVKDKYRERFVNNLKDDDRGIDLSKYAEEPYKVFCEFMDSIPPVNLKEPRAGHWVSNAIQGEIDGQIIKAFTCSECGAISVFRMADGKIVNGDLCPNCGCCMIEPQKSEK